MGKNFEFPFPHFKQMPTYNDTIGRESQGFNALLAFIGERFITRQGSALDQLQVLPGKVLRFIR